MFQLSPILALLLVHDLLLAKRGIALPATHGLRACVEKHKARLQAELTKARIRRARGSLEALKAYVDADEENIAKGAEPPHPRWVRVNALKSTLEDQIKTTFAEYTKVEDVAGVRQYGSKRIYVDEHVPNLVAIPAGTDLTKSEAYKTGAIILQDKASCFPAYLLDPRPEDGIVMDTCAAPGNKTTHVAGIMGSRMGGERAGATIVHAFEKNKFRAETLHKMVSLAGAGEMTKIHAGQDFLRVKPESPDWAKVGALLLDPSCSGSGIVGRDEMPELHLPEARKAGPAPQKGSSKGKGGKKESLKRKREEETEPAEVMVDDDGNTTTVTTEEELQSRLTALASFQLELLLHAFKFPAARKITYSTCSIHAEENERVVMAALDSDVGKQRGWRILKREEQVDGMRAWPVRGEEEACKERGDVAQGCIRAAKGDGRGTMGFFVAGFVRGNGQAGSPQREKIDVGEISSTKSSVTIEEQHKPEETAEPAPDDDFIGFEDDDENEINMVDSTADETVPGAKRQRISGREKADRQKAKHSFGQGKQKSTAKGKGKR